MNNQRKKRKKNIVFLILAIFFLCTFRINPITSTVTLLSNTAKAETTKETEKTQTLVNSETAIIAASSGVSYNLDFSAYDPLYYNFKVPTDYGDPPTYAKRPTGRDTNPMLGADGSHPRLESLEPSQLALGQIVPYEVEITVKGNTPENGTTIYFTNSWGTKTTSGDDFGFDPKYKVFAAFVDYGDKNNVDKGNNASAKIFSSEIVGDDIKGTFEISGLDDGDKIIVEIWLVLKSELPAIKDPTGNVHANLDNAATSTGEPISSAGNKTIPLSQVGKFTAVTADVGIVKSDSPDPLYTGDTLTYIVTVTNNSSNVVANGIVVTDTLDPKVTFVSASNGGTLSGNVITWPAFALEPKSQKVITVTVRVNSDAPTDIYKGTAPHNGSASEVRLAGADITNIVKFIMITDDSNKLNNIWQEPTNVLPRISITAYKVWVGGPAADHRPVELTLYRQVGNEPKEVVTGINPTITPESGTADRFTYTWNGLPTYNPSFQQYVYTVDEVTVPENYTKSASVDTITNTYKPSLVIIKAYGEIRLSGAVFDLYAGNSSGRIGASLKTITTGSDGKAIFEYLEDGTYWLMETKPPLGYRPIDDIGPFIVTNGIITGPSGYTPVSDGEIGKYALTVQNQPARALPATGGIGTIPFLLSGLGMMIFVLFLKRRKNMN